MPSKVLKYDLRSSQMVTVHFRGQRFECDICA